MRAISDLAILRLDRVSISPPQAHLVPAMVEDMCEYVMDNANTSEALHLCAYVMWRLNWIHPFTDGNGRTSRALAYYVLCGRVGYLLPGRETVPEQIAADRNPYYEALEDADRHFENGVIDLSKLEALLGQCLATQLLSAYNDAKDPLAGGRKDRKYH
jgi:Fic family protein